MIDWRVVHERLVGISKRRAALDAEEMRWLRLAEDVQIWSRFGMVNMLDYLERKLGYAPHTAGERVRVARELAALPIMEARLAAGELCFSAVRELTRVATPATERAWCDDAAGKNLRQIEERVAGLSRGALPGDPGQPELAKKKIVLEVSVETYARFRDVRAVLSDERGRRLNDDAIVSAMCEATLSGGGADEGRAKFQVAIQVCPTCDGTWQDGGGRTFPVDRVTRERAECDAQRIGSLDGPAPERAGQDVPPATRRFVWRRDHGRCSVPGCRSSRSLEIHHLIPRAQGGDHDPKHIVLLCGSCHAAHHRGDLVIAGTADKLAVRRPRDPDVPVDASHVGAPTAIDAGLALESMGWPPVGPRRPFTSMGA